jgi:hypothetical protein
LPIPHFTVGQWFTFILSATSPFGTRRALLGINPDSEYLIPGFQKTYRSRIMTLNHPHPATKTNRPHLDRDDGRQRAEEVLRDIAFVLRMTEKVRTEIEADEEANEPVLV